MDEKEIRQHMDEFNAAQEENKKAEEHMDEIVKLIDALPLEKQEKVFEHIAEILQLLSDSVYKSLKEAERVLQKSKEKR